MPDFTQVTTEELRLQAEAHKRAADERNYELRRRELEASRHITAPPIYLEPHTVGQLVPGDVVYNTRHICDEPGKLYLEGYALHPDSLVYVVRPLPSVEKQSLIQQMDEELERLNRRG